MIQAVESAFVAKISLEPSAFSLELICLSNDQNTNQAKFLDVVNENNRFSTNLLLYVNRVSKIETTPVCSIAEAVAKLGTVTVANLSLFFSLLAQYREGKCPQFDYQRFWQKSLAMGCAARALATVQKINSDKLFTYGVLCRIGELALATIHPKDYSNLLSQELPFDTREQEERKLFGSSSSDLTSEILSRWQVSSQCAETISTFNLGSHIQCNRSETTKVCKILKLAALLVKISLLELPLSETFISAEKEAEIQSIPVDKFGSLFDQFISSWQTTNTFFKIPTVHCPNYNQIKIIDDAAIEIDGNKPPALTFLAVDDDPMTLIYLKKMINKGGRHLLTAENGDQALKLALEHRPHILITDWRMPGLNGIELCKILRKTKLTQHIYIIMLTCNETEDELVQAFDAGADDYVVKPIPPKVLQARISCGERLILYQQTIHQDRETIQRYATRLATANSKLQNMAMTDFLTGLTNRRNALLRLKNLVAEVKRYGEPLSCLMLDIDYFKTINDTYGHDCGDTVLKKLSNLFVKKARSYDIVSRWGGEEFLIICARSGPTDSLQLAERLRQTVEQYKIYLSDEVAIKVTISIGIATWSTELQNEDELIKEADTSLYLAKENGRNRVESSSGINLPVVCLGDNLK